MGGNMVCIMGITADGDDFPAKLPVSFQNAHAGVEIPHPLADTACIQLNSLSLFQNLKQNGIQDIFIFS